MKAPSRELDITAELQNSVAKIESVKYAPPANRQWSDSGNAFEGHLLIKRWVLGV